MNYTYAKARFKHRFGIATDAHGRLVLRRNKLTKELEIIPTPERVMAGKASMESPTIASRNRKRAKRHRLNPGRRTVEENRRAR